MTEKTQWVVTEDGARLHCLDQGQGPSLVFVPGWTMPGEVWRYQIDYFAEAFRVVTVDPRSQGESSQMSYGHYPEAQAQDLKSVIDQLGLAPVVFIGWSIAVKQLMAYVELYGTATIAGLVLVDGDAGRDLDVEFAHEMLWICAFLERDRHGFARKFIETVFKQATNRSFLVQIRNESMKTPNNSAVALYTGSVATDKRHVLEAIDRPTLIAVAGDRESSSLTRARTMHAKIPSSEWAVLENMGHGLFVDDPNRFNRLLEEFLTRRCFTASDT